MSVDVKVPQYKKDREEAKTEKMIKLLIGKTPKQAKNLIKSEVSSGNLSRDDVLLGLVGAITYIVNRDNDSDD